MSISLAVIWALATIGGTATVVHGSVPGDRDGSPSVFVMADVAVGFVERFQTWCAAPDPAMLGTLLSPDVILFQPVLPRTVGLESAERFFRRLITALPDITGTVHRWAADGNLIFIEFNLEATLGGRPIAWDNIDRFIIGAEGLATERLNCHDSIALVGRMLSRPRGWAPILRSGLLRRR